MLRRLYPVACSVLLSFALTACGGGNSSPSSSSSNTPAPPTTAGNGSGGAGSGGSAAPSSSQPGNNSGGSAGTGSGSSGSGGSGTPASPAAALTNANFAYVYNSAGSTIDGFKIEQSTGALSPVSGSPFTTLPSGRGIVTGGGILYVSGGVPNSAAIAAYKIASDGNLSPLGSTPSPELIDNLYLHSSGKFLYGATAQDGIAGFQIVAPGQLSPISGLPQSLGPDVSMALSPDGQWAFVSHQQTSAGGSAIETYAIDSSTGHWSGPVVYPNSPAHAGGAPSQIGKGVTRVHLAVDPSSKFLFAANPYQNMVLAFRIGSDGSLTPAGSATGSSTAPWSLAAGTTFAYFGDFNQASLYGYSFGSGVLTATPGSPYKNVMAPAYNMVLDSAGHVLYVANNDPGSISVWKVAADGSLSQVAGSPFQTPEMFGKQPAYIALQ